MILCGHELFTATDAHTVSRMLHFILIVLDSTINGAWGSVVVTALRY